MKKHAFRIQAPGGMLGLVLALYLATESAAAQPAAASERPPCCRVSVETGAYTLNDPGWARPGTGTIVRLANASVSIDVLPDAGGNLNRFLDSAHPSDHPPFSRVDDSFEPCGQWKPGPFAFRVDDGGTNWTASVFAEGPDRVAATVFAEGPLVADGATVGVLRVERTVAVHMGSSLVFVDVGVSNAGDTPMKAVRYMVHALYEFKVFPGGTANVFMPGKRGIETHDNERVVKDMHLARHVGPGHPWRRWASGPIQKPRHAVAAPPDGLSWAVLHTDSGIQALAYPPEAFDFVHLWTGTHPGEWFVIEPVTKAHDLQPGESFQFSYLLTADPRDIPGWPDDGQGGDDAWRDLQAIVESWDTPPDARSFPPMGKPSHRRKDLQSPAASEWTNSVGLVFVDIPAGVFTMGASPDDLVAHDDEKPAREVRLTHGFRIGKWPVRNAEYRRYKPTFKSETGPSHYRERQAPQVNADDQPALMTDSWESAKAFCEWLNATDTTRPDGHRYRLPTEAEWEYAATGGSPRAYPWGDDWNARRLNFGERGLRDGFRPTSPVGAFSPSGDSPFGLADMAGNVWEWCEDFYAPDFYTRAPGENPVNTEPAQTHVVRGGSWASRPAFCRTTARFGLFGTHPPTMGFRVVLAPAASMPE